MYLKNLGYPTYLLHFQHKGRRISFKVIINTNAGENLVSNTERGIFSRYTRAWNNHAIASLPKVNQCTASCSFALQIYLEVKNVAADLFEP